ncbi:MAG: flavin monoamine oxidase family protein [Actinomycetales bacterium]
MDLFDGWGGFLGFRDTHFPDTRTVGSLRAGIQRFPDVPTIQYNDYLIDSTGATRAPLLDRKSDNGKAINANVALIGAGIANLIAAYELSRCGVKVTVFEQQADDPTKGQKPFGGRLTTDVKDGYVAELGAAAFPAQSPLLWHYVWRWAVSEGMSEADADKLIAKRFPSPGTVPTLCCYLNEWFEPSKDLNKLPSAVREAAYRFRSWLQGLNDGTPEPRTVYLKDAIRQATDPVRGPHLTQFWRAMIRKYGGRSFGSVLRTEVFSTATNAGALFDAFAAVGVGTGGFGPVDDISVLEVLRHVVWDSTSLFMLPDVVRREEHAGKRGAHMQGFAEGLANYGLLQSQSFYPGRAFDDMFRFGAPVESLCVIEAEDKTQIGVCLANKDPILFDYTIVAISSRAMQALGLGQDHPTKNPFRTWGIHTPNSTMAVHSVQAAVHQLNMTSSYKSFARIPQPETISAWPTNQAGQLVKCFITDRYPRTMIVMPPLPGQADTMLVAADTWSDDALKFQDLRGTSLPAQLGRVVQAFQPPDKQDSRFKAVADELLATTDQRDRDWNTTVGFNGGVKLNRPDDEYFAGSLLCQSQLVYERDSEKQPWGRTFLAGDSVGYLGGWAEGAAMSALTATAAVLYQVRKGIKDGNPGELGAAQMLDPNAAAFHTWTPVSAKTVTAPPELKSLTAVRRAEDHSEQMPPRWRWDATDASNVLWGLTDLAVSQDGLWMTCSVDGTTTLWRRFDPRSGEWGMWADIDVDGGLEGIAVSASASRYVGRADAEAQAVGFSPGMGLYHTADLGQHGFEPIDLGGWAPGDHAAIAVLDRPPPTSAHVVILRDDDAILHSIRDPQGNWAMWQSVPSGTGHLLYGEAVALATCPGTEYLVLVYIDAHETVTVIGRHWDTTWTAPVPAPNGNLGAVRVSVVGMPETLGRVEIVADFSDGNVYHRLFDVLGHDDYPWRPVPYPATSAFNLTNLAIGASPDICDYKGSTRVWITGDALDASTDQEVEDQ